MSNSKFTRPVENLASNASGYVSVQWDNLKLRTVKALSAGTGKIVWFIVLFIMAGVLIMTLSFALIFWLGDLMGSLALGALIASGAIALILVIFFLLRKVLFRGSLVSTYTRAFFPKGNEDVKNFSDLEKALVQNEQDITNQGARVTQSFDDVKSFYTDPRLYLDSLGPAVGWVTSLFSKKNRDERKEEKAAKKEEKAAKKEEKAALKEELAAQKEEEKAAKKEEKAARKEEKKAAKAKDAESEPAEEPQEETQE